VEFQEERHYTAISGEEGAGPSLPCFFTLPVVPDGGGQPAHQRVAERGDELPVFNPIVTARKLRRFGVLDLEWVPGEVLPSLVNTTVKLEGVRQKFRVPLPVHEVMTTPLRLRLGGYYDQVPRGDEHGGEAEMEERYFCFPTIHELVVFLLSRDHRGHWFFAHAGGLADMQFVLDDLLAEIKAQLRVAGPGTRSTATFAPGGERLAEEVRALDADGRCWKIRASFSGSSAIIVHVSSGKNAWHFVDSYWLLRDKLANIGKAIGIKKGDSPAARAWMSQRFGRQVDDFDTLSREEKRIFYAEVPIEILTEYNRIDCEILWKAVAAFEAEIVGLGGQLQQTIASTAMSLFRRSFLQRDIFTSERLNQLSEEAYFASRVEVLSRNASRFNIFDINSSFPNAMTYPLPGNLLEYRTTLPDDDSDSCIYLADATIEVPEMHAPPLPYRKDNRVFFPTGRWRSWFTSTDIRLALREGATLHKVHEVYVFEAFGDFGDYARKIYALRAEAKTDFRRLVLKYLLNSLYGKCAESQHKQEMLINPNEIDRATMQMLQPGVWLCEKEAKIAHRHVVVAAVITAIARRTLYDYIKECERQGKPAYYCDSVSGERTVVLRSPGGHVFVEPVEEVWARWAGQTVEHHGDKEASDLGGGWQALARDSGGREGWFPLRRVIRHASSKPLHLVSSKRGQVRVTSDHSIMVGGEEVSPDDFMRRRLQFDVVRAPAAEVAGVLDLYEHVRDFRRSVATRRGEVVHKFDLSKDGKWIVYSNLRVGNVRVRRYYESESREMRSFLRVLAAFVAEGSSSLRGITTGTRDMFSLCQQDRGWLKGLATDIRMFARGVRLLGPKWSEGSGVYYLRSGTQAMACLFGYLGGIAGSRGRKMPSLVYELSDDDFGVFWDVLVQGDGSVDRSDREGYTTASQSLAAGVSYALSQRGMEHSIHYRPSKGSYFLRRRPDGSERRRWTTLHEVSLSGGIVYDLEVEGAHTFVDGLGRVLLHNTDSVATRAKLPTDDKTLGALKLEKKMRWAEFVAPKIYRGEGFELKRDGTWEEKRLTKAKGFSLGSGQEAWDKLDKIVSGDRVGVQRMTRMRELYRTMVQGQYTTAPFEMLVVKALTFEMLSKRFHYPDGETRPWTVAELRSGDRVPGGFDFESEIRSRFDSVTKAMLAAAV
jgi:hypothetical protein